MQYLVGLKYFQEAPIFSPELFVTLRKRIDDKFFNDIMLSMHKDCIKKSGSPESEQSDKSDSGTSGNSHPSESSPVTHKGKMKIDATCTDAEMKYPAYINILEDSSREIERLAQKVSSQAGIAKPRNCRGEAHSCFVRYTKKKHKGRKLIRETQKLFLHLLSKDVQGFINLLGRLGTDVLS